ncbi:helix-turn-helix domain-containing protein [Thermomonospora cellulosilytica]|uniref:Excisionase family DNA binding protein n=1 Tax=Thermomonospora cellulosilytica TaxID=1411118 RepID=A0A7W3R8I6_9ACTN|nr:helix-turn-helix domain-containing protein [Thermomonospora cellulosilytica]MBA9003707.1 excisionase family DNA binding protein [Thermomonospora cellulosilytica]
MSYLTRAEVAATLRVHERTVDRYVRQGLLKAIKAPGPNGSVRISEESLKEYLESQTVQPSAKAAS